MQQDDRQRLLRQLANPKERENAFAYIVKLYKEPLYWKIRSMVLSHEDANDLLQNTFLKAWNGLDSFHGEAKVETWLYRIAVNETLDFLRKQKLRSGLSSEMSDRVAAQLMADPTLTATNRRLCCKKLYPGCLRCSERCSHCAIMTI